MVQHIVIVCGYGPELTDSLKVYLDEVVAFCKAYRPGVLICCGGCSRQRTRPGVSEAEVMMEYLKSKLQGGACPWWRFLDESSLTTIENIQNAQEILGKYNLLDNRSEISIFCNTSKGFVIKRLARHFFPQMMVVIEPIYWKVEDPWLMQALVNLYTLAAIRIPALARFYRNLRMKQFATM